MVVHGVLLAGTEAGPDGTTGELGVLSAGGGVTGELGVLSAGGVWTSVHLVQIVLVVVR